MNIELINRKGKYGLKKGKKWIIELQEYPLDIITKHNFKISAYDDTSPYTWDANFFIISKHINNSPQYLLLYDASNTSIHKNMNVDYSEIILESPKNEFSIKLEYKSSSYYGNDFYYITNANKIGIFIGKRNGCTWFVEPCITSVEKSNYPFISPGIGDKYGLIYYYDNEMSWIYQIQYDDLKIETYKDYYIYLTSNKNKMGLLSLGDPPINLKPEFDSINELDMEGFFAVKKSENCSLIFTHKKERINYWEIKDEQWIFQFNGDKNDIKITDFNEYFTLIKIKDKHGLLKKNSLFWFLKPQYTNIEMQEISNLHYLIKADNQIGIYNHKKSHWVLIPDKDVISYLDYIDFTCKKKWAARHQQSIRVFFLKIQGPSDNYLLLLDNYGFVSSKFQKKDFSEKRKYLFPKFYLAISDGKWGLYFMKNSVIKWIVKPVWSGYKFDNDGITFNSIKKIQMLPYEKLLNISINTIIDNGVHE